MRILIAAIGRIASEPHAGLCAHYAERLNAMGRQVALGPVEIMELAESRARQAATRKGEEAERLLARIASADGVIALDEAGKAMTSTAFATFVAGRRDEGTRTLAFLIGGPDGHGRAVRERADLALSLGPMTLPHALARIVLLEQLYRAATILAGHPYHRP